MPIYYRGIPGNVVDVSTLTATIKELSGYPQFPRLIGSTVIFLKVTIAVSKQYK